MHTRATKMLTALRRLSRLFPNMLLNSIIIVIINNNVIAAFTVSYLLSTSSFHLPRQRLCSGSSPPVANSCPATRMGHWQTYLLLSRESGFSVPGLSYMILVCLVKQSSINAHKSVTIPIFVFVCISLWGRPVIGRNTGLARPSVRLSVRLSVCPVQGPNSKTKERRKPTIGVNVRQGRSSRCPSYQFIRPKVRLRVAQL